MEIKLVLVKNNGDYKIFPLVSGVAVLGRRSDCDLRIPLMSVSRRHCQINLDNGNIKVRDLGSTNGTVINGEVVDEAVIKAGDKIKVGSLSFVLQVDGVPNEFAAPPSLKEEASAKDESKEALSDILDGALVDENLSEVDEGESEDLDFLLNED
ncbi:MAG: FHA domain-containing protein [Planctomycetota bacterium]|jgi:pSer/pThr/pTyr-binding forkhead associated (FHA) protein